MGQTTTKDNNKRLETPATGKELKLQLIGAIMPVIYGKGVTI
jgi:hypothetical protein